MIIDTYAGPGGWSQGLRTLGLNDIGIEHDTAACATRAAAGHKTIRADVAAMPLEPLVGQATGLIMSPPCQSFSTAGKGEGRDLLNPLCQAVTDGAWWAFDRDGGYGHVLEVGRWAETLRPTWIACEQVPPVLPVWRAYADRWRALGWTAWAGILNAADYGVPQTRRRAFLIARTDGRPVGPPEPTHTRGVTMFGLRPWVSWGEALGIDGRLGFPRIDDTGTSPDGYRERDWRPADQPAWTLTEKARSWVIDRRQQSNGVPVRLVPHTEPVPTLTGTAGAKSQWLVDGTPLTIAQALILQGFPPDYPVQGTRTKQFEQVGNAVPPLLAVQVLRAVID